MFIINCEYIDKEGADIMSGFSAFFSACTLIVAAGSFCKYVAKPGADMDSMNSYV